jgi:hypothetical protein
MNQRTKMLQALFMSMQIRPENNPMDAAIILQSLCDAMETETPTEAVASVLQMSKDQEKFDLVSLGLDDIAAAVEKVRFL